MIDPIFRTETNRGLQPPPQMAARRIRNVQAMMTVTEGILSSASLPVRHSKLIPYPSVTISVPKEIQRSISIISATLDKFAPVERHQLVPIVAVV